MNIAIFTDTYSPDINGVAKSLQRLCNYLDSNNHNYRVFAPKHAKSKIYSENIFHQSSIPFFLYPECRFSIPNLLHVKAELKEFKPDIIHVATPFTIGLCGIYYAQKLNIPLVGSYHTDFHKYLDYYNLQFLSKTLWKYLYWFYKPMAKIFAPSKDTLQHLTLQGFKNVSMWSRGVDTSIFHPNYSPINVRKKYHIKEKFILSYVGRLAPEKNVALLKKIILSLPTEMSKHIHWLIVGEGPSKLELMNNTPTNVTFTGYLQNEKLGEIYASSDLFIFPSSTETFGNVVLESLAAGTPVIATDAGGVRTIIQDKKTGILTKSNNVEEYVHYIRYLLEQETVRKKMSLAGYLYAKDNHWDNHFKLLVDEYETIISQTKLLRKYA